MTTLHRAPKHPVMRLCLNKGANRDPLWLRWPGSSQSHGGRLRFGFCLGRSLNFKEGYKQAPDLPTHEPLTMVEAQERPEGRGLKGDRMLPAPRAPWRPQVGMGDVSFLGWRRTRR